MASSDEKARLRLERLEREAREHPLRHRLRLGALAAVGYAYPTAILLLSLLVVCGTLAFLAVLAREEGNRLELGIVWFLILLGGVAIAVWVIGAFLFDAQTIDSPLLHPGASRLAEEVEAIRRQLNVPAIAEIRIGAGMNAGVSQSFRWGFVGRPQNRLVLGVPLMMALTPEEVRAIIAHELGHLGGNHGRFSAWIFRMYLAWDRLATIPTKGGGLARLPLSWFLGWYHGWLVESTLPLRRLHEYEADKASAAITGAQTAAAALIKVHWFGERLSRECMPAIRALIPDEAMPPMDFLQRQRAVFQTPASEERYGRWVAREGRVKTHIQHEHPCLADRLAALGQQSSLEPGAEPPRCPPDEESGLALLGSAAEFHLSRANLLWRSGQMAAWRNIHAAIDRIRRGRQRPTERTLDEGGPDAPAQREWDNVCVTINYSMPNQSEALLRDFLGRNPDYPAAVRELGELLLGEEDEDGIEWIERAMELRSDYRLPGLGILLEFFRTIGDDARADAVLARIEEEENLYRGAERERKSVRASDELVSHSLDESALQAVRRCLGFHPRIKLAWLVRKKVSLHADRPAYVLGIVCRPSTSQSDNWLARALPSQLALPCTVVVLGITNRRLRNRLEKISGSLVLSESDSV